MGPGIVRIGVSKGRPGLIIHAGVVIDLVIFRPLGLPIHPPVPSRQDITVIEVIARIVKNIPVGTIQTEQAVSVVCHKRPVHTS